MDEKPVEEHHYNLPPEEDPWYKGPIKYMIGLFLLLLLLVWFIPSQSVKIDPRPSYIPTIEEVVPNIVLEGNETQVTLRQYYPSLVTPNDPLVKQTADKIVNLACEGNKVCHAKAIFYFVRDNFQYVSDPNQYEYVKSAKESLATGVGDCDDASVLLSNLLQAVGIPTRFVFIPGHVYVQAYLPDALKRYKTESTDYISLDATCHNCEFAQLPYSDYTDNKQFI